MGCLGAVANHVNSHDGAHDHVATKEYMVP